MAEKLENANYFPAEELEVDAEVTSRGTGVHEALTRRHGPGTSLQSTPTGLLSNEQSQSHSTVSSPAYLLAGPDRPMDQNASLHFRLDKAHNALLDAHNFLYQQCKVLNNDNRHLQERNDELMRKLAEMTMENHRLKEFIKNSCGGDGHTNMNEEMLEADYCVEGVLQKPTTTTSIGHKARDVDPLAIHIKQAGLDQGAGPLHGCSLQNPGVGQNERVELREGRIPAKEPSPEDCANFLAGIIKPGDDFKEVLRSLKLSSVDIEDITNHHPNDPKEQRIAGITKALSQQPHRDRISVLLCALVKAGMRYQAEEFCKEFKIDQRLVPALPAEVPPQLPAQVPAPEPQNRLEEALKPFLKDPKKLPVITDEVKKERRLTDPDKKTFKGAFVSWKHQQKTKFDEFCVSLSLLGVLNAWASVELSQYSDHDALPEYSIECLVRSCRSVKRVNLLKKLKKLLHTGVVGPSEQRDTYLRKVSHTLRHNLIAQLNLKRSVDGKDWRALAESVGYNSQITLWQAEQRPAEHLWAVWTSSTNATVGDLYDWALKNNRLDIVGIMEDEM